MMNIQGPWDFVVDFVSVTEKNLKILRRYAPVKTNDLSTKSMILIILGAVFGCGLCLHCCWCCFLYCLIWCRDRSLSRQMRHRQQYLPKLPFVILHPEQNKSVIGHSFSSFTSTSMMSTMNKTTTFQSNRQQQPLPNI
uniref:Uncharacterized protein n=1 Tax=Romanomermis culicivorax TaxID=13658 RepID=A0A915JJQ1_ROMCU